MARRPTEDEEDALIVAQALVFDAIEAPTKAGRVAAGEAGLGERSSRRWGHLWAVMETRLCMRARHGLAETMKTNPHVRDLLCGDKAMPRRPPPYYGPGEASEAVVYLQEFRSAWRHAPGALDWVRARARAKTSRGKTSK